MFCVYVCNCMYLSILSYTSVDRIEPKINDFSSQNHFLVSLLIFFCSSDITNFGGYPRMSWCCQFDSKILYDLGFSDELYSGSGINNCVSIDLFYSLRCSLQFWDVPENLLRHSLPDIHTISLRFRIETVIFYSCGHRSFLSSMSRQHLSVVPQFSSTFSSFFRVPAAPHF